MQPSPPTSLAYSLSHPNKKVLLAFAVYGLVAGIVWVIDSESYEQNVFSTISFPMNYPTFIALLIIVGEHYPIPVPIPVWNVIIVLGSIAVWTTIGFIGYCFYKVFTSRAID